MDVSHTFLSHLLRFCNVQRQDVIPPTIQHVQFGCSRFFSQTGELPVVGKDIYVPPLREDFPYVLGKRLDVRHELVLKVENGDFCDFGATGANVSCGKIPYGRRSRRRIRYKWRRYDNKIVQMGVHGSLRT